MKLAGCETEAPGYMAAANPVCLGAYAVCLICREDGSDETCLCRDVAMRLHLPTLMGPHIYIVVIYASHGVRVGHGSLYPTRMTTYASLLTTVWARLQVLK